MSAPSILTIRQPAIAATGAWFSSEPFSVGADGAGNVFIAEGSRIRRVDIATGIINTICGLADPGTPVVDISASAGDGGPATNATLTVPFGVTADRAGDVFVLDGDNDNVIRIRRIDAVTGIINTIAGGGTNVPGTGPATNMVIDGSLYLGVNDSGTKLFIGDFARVYQVDLVTGILSPCAGNGTQGYGGDGGPALSARLDVVSGLTVAPGGGLLISDSGNRRVRYVVPDSITLTNDPGQLEFHLPWVNSLNGDLIIVNNTNLTVVDAGSVTNVGGDVVINAGSNAVSGTVSLGSLTTVNGSVVINASSNAIGGTLDLGSLTTVSGSVNITESGTLDLGSLTAVIGSINITGSGTLDLGSLTTVGGSITITNTGTEVIDAGSLTTVSGSLDLSGNTSATNIDLGSLTNVCGSITIVSNAPDVVIDLNSLATAAGCGTNPITMTVDGTVMATNGITIETNATLAGSATVDGPVTNNGTISPGSSPGHLSFMRNLGLNSSSRLQFEIGGDAPNQFDSASVAGALTLGGALSVSLINSFPRVMTNGASFTVVTSGNPINGSFANVASGGTLTTTDGHAQFTVVYAGDTSVRLTNLQILNVNADSDGDGVSDADELAAGTDPNNPASVFRILGIQREADGLRISWSTVGGKSYVVQTNNPPAAGSFTNYFTDFSPPITVSGIGESTTNALAPSTTNSPARYYRIRLGP